MRLTRDDIIYKAMSFNEGEVKAFLETVAGEFEELTNENTSLKKQLEEEKARVNLITGTVGELREILNALKPKEVEFATKEDIERFFVTARKIKEEELRKADEEAERIVNEAQQRARALINDAENDVGDKKEEASLILNEAHQKAEEMIRDAEGEAEKIMERAAQVIRDAQQRAKEAVKYAENQAERKREEAAQIIRGAQQKSGTILREAKGEEERIRIQIANLKKQYRLFEDRVKEAVEFHLDLLSPGAEKAISEQEIIIEEGDPDTLLDTLSEERQKDSLSINRSFIRDMAYKKFLSIKNSLSRRKTARNRRLNRI
ncbi:MAG TPA: hypothetical protein VHT73_03100 [Thermodesulfobacteriota bacterium]|nr:hypothetical protein [Thermodesulfobacteriota bacterium]